MTAGRANSNLVKLPLAAAHRTRRTVERLYDSYVWSYLNSRNVFASEWDLCVVLDACRFDLGYEASQSRSWLPDPEAVWSVGSNSETWYRETVRNAPPDVLNSTALVSANPHTPAVRDTPWELLDEVWTYVFDEEHGTVPPRPVTDRAIDISRDRSPDRLLVHYMQPHLPPVHTSVPELGWSQETQDWHDEDPWNRASDGDLDPDYIEQLYRENIDPVLAEVELLLENVDAERAVITADHGNYIGENGKWSHHPYEREAPVRQVPWWQTTAEDRETHEPAEYDRDPPSTSRDEQLKALGYR